MAFTGKWFNAKYYLEQNSDVSQWGGTALEHYMAWGATEGRAPNAWFDAQYYRANNPDLDAAGLNGLALFAHYEQYGYNEGRAPSATYANFDEAAYLANNPDLGLAGIEAEGALNHYLVYGMGEGRAAQNTDGTSITPSVNTFTLTANPDMATANIFEAPRVWNPAGTDFMNSLNDDDVLTGTGDNPTLNLTFVNDTESGDMNLMPSMTNIETVNARFTADVAQTLDLQDTTGIANLAATAIDNTVGAVTFDNIQSVLTTANVANSNDNTASNMIFDHAASALAGDTDEVALTISDVQMNNLRIDGVTQGYETINLSSSGEANSLNSLTAEELETLNIDGDQDLRLGASANVTNGVTGLVEATNYTAGFVSVAGSFDTLDASTFTGVLDVTMGNEVNAGQDGTSGISVDFSLTGGEGNDMIRFAAGTNLDTGDTINGGAGETETNTLVTYGSSAFAGTVSNVQELEIRSGHDNLVAADAVTIDTALFTELENTLIRNEGQNALASAAEGLATTLNNMTDAQAAALTYLHGTTGNNGILNNALTVDFATNAATNTVGLTFADAANTDLRFNMQVTSPEANSMTFTDSDTESNTVGLNSFATVDTAITVTGGSADTYFNLDRTANGFGFDQTGGTLGDARLGVAAAFTAAPGVITQVSAIDTAVNETYGYATTVGSSGQYTVFNSVAGGELLTTPTIDASDTASDVIVRVGTANQTISTNTGNDTVIFADTAGISAATSGLTISDTVAMGTGTDTLVLDGRAAAVNVGASEWTNLSGVDVLRLGGAPGATAFQVQVTDQLVDQTDDGSNLVIINNDGDLRNANENAATVDLTSMSAANGVTFIGADGDGSVAQVGKAVQTVILDDVTANGNSTLDGGDRNIINAYNAAEFGTQAAADAAYLANVAANRDGNDNVYRVNSSGTNAEVTVGDLGNVTNFSTLQWINDAAVSRDMTLTLDSATVGDLVDASHTANTTAVETLRVEAVDSTTVAGATADMILAAGTVSNAYSLQVMAGRGVDNITTGAGADVVVMAGGYVAGTYGVDATTGFNINARSTPTAAVHNVTDTVDMGAGTDRLITYGAINLAGATLAGIETITALSALVINLSQWDAMVAAAAAAGTPTSDLITFEGNSAHQLTIVNDVAGGGTVDLSRINLNGGSLTYDVTSATSGVGSGAIATSNAVDIPASNPTGVATTGVVGTAPANGGTPTAGIVNLAAGGTYTGTAGVDEQFTGAIATLNGTTITGNAADTESLVLTDAGTVALNNGTTGGTLDNIDTVKLADGANTVSFTAATTNGFSGITGGTGNDTVSLTNFDAGGTVALGAGIDTVNNATEAIVEVAGSTFNGGSGAEVDVFNFANGVNTGTLVLSNITDFETLNLGTVAGNTTTTDFANGVTTLIGNTTTNSITVTMTMAQLDALTTITNTNGSSNFNITLTTAGTIDLSSSEVDLSGGAGEIDVLTFAAGANTVRVDATAIADIADNAVAGGTDDILQIEDTSVVTDNVFNDFNTLTSVGSGIDITDAGLDVVRSINGDAGDNTISIGAATEVKTIDISQGGTDTIDTDATEAAGARAIVTGFTAGLGGDIFNSAAETLTGTGNFGATSSLYTHSTSGNLDITTGGTTDIAEVFIITSAQLNTNLTTTAAANDLDGTNLLTAIGGTITATTGDDVLFAVQDTNGNTGIYLASEANDTAITAAEINLIGVLANTGVADLTVNNFTNA